MYDNQTMSAVYLAGVGMTKFGKSAQTLVELFCDADLGSETLIPSPKAHDPKRAHAGNSLDGE